MRSEGWRAVCTCTTQGRLYLYCTPVHLASAGASESEDPLRMSLLVLLLLTRAAGHGRLRQPASRSTMWRYGFHTPANVNDHESNCGGFGRQWDRNQGQCGVCGDPFDLPQPRPNELGGKYGLGVVAANLTQGQVLNIQVELTAFHQGYFEFRLCKHNTKTRPVTQQCLDQHLLAQVTGDSKYFPEPPPPGGLYNLKYRLPPHLTCALCVLQWRYVAGNSWGKCSNGTEAVGCGAQEEFRACADLMVASESGWYDTSPSEATALTLSLTLSLTLLVVSL